MRVNSRIELFQSDEFRQFLPQVPTLLDIFPFSVQCAIIIQIITRNLAPYTLAASNHQV